MAGSLPTCATSGHPRLENDSRVCTGRLGEGAGFRIVCKDGSESLAMSYLSLRRRHCHCLNVDNIPLELAEPGMPPTFRSLLAHASGMGWVTGTLLHPHVQYYADI